MSFLPQKRANLSDNQVEYAIYKRKDHNNCNNKKIRIIYSHRLAIGYGLPFRALKAAWPICNLKITDLSVYSPYTGTLTAAEEVVAEKMNH